MLPSFVEDPVVSGDHALPNPGPTAILVVGSDDDGILAVTGVLQCTAIFFYNPNNRKRMAAHFGGWRNKRAPKTEDLREAWNTVLGDSSGDRIQVTLCMNSSSPENSIEEARGQVEALNSQIKIDVEDYPGNCFYMFGDGRLFGGGTPVQVNKPSFSFGGSRRKVDEKK
jgi:hypothetical protein